MFKQIISCVKTNILAFSRIIRLWLKLLGKSKYVHVDSNVHIGKGGRLWAPDKITIGANSYIGKYVYIEVNTHIGTSVLIANHVKFAGKLDHDLGQIGVPIRFAKWIGDYDVGSKERLAKVNIEDDVWIGVGAILLGPINVGRGAIVAAGALVVKDVKPYSIVGGNPAKILRYRFTPEEIVIHENSIRTGAFEYNIKGLKFSKIRPNLPKIQNSK